MSKQRRVRIGKLLFLAIKKVVVSIAYTYQIIIIIIIIVFQAFPYFTMAIHPIYNIINQNKYIIVLKKNK